jgi:hypothetical protein
MELRQTEKSSSLGTNRIAHLLEWGRAVIIIAAYTACYGHVPQLLAAVAGKDAAGLLDKIGRLGATGLLGQRTPQFPGKSWRERNQAQDTHFLP